MFMNSDVTISYKFFNLNDFKNNINFYSELMETTISCNKMFSCILWIKYLLKNNINFYNELKEIQISSHKITN